MAELGTNAERPARPRIPWFTVAPIANGVLVYEQGDGRWHAGNIDLEKCLFFPDGNNAGVKIMQRIQEVAQEQFHYDNPQPTVNGTDELRDLNAQQQTVRCPHTRNFGLGDRRCELATGHPGNHKNGHGLDQFSW